VRLRPKCVTQRRKDVTLNLSLQEDERVTLCRLFWPVIRKYVTRVANDPADKVGLTELLLNNIILPVQLRQLMLSHWHSFELLGAE
jgi:hypothetical protein